MKEMVQQATPPSDSQAQKEYRWSRPAGSGGMLAEKSEDLAEEQALDGHGTYDANSNDVAREQSGQAGDHKVSAILTPQWEVFEEWMHDLETVAEEQRLLREI
jgi:hypothetical protein